MHCLIVTSHDMSLLNCFKRGMLKSRIHIYFTFNNTLLTKQERQEVYRDAKKKFPKVNLVLPEDLGRINITWDAIVYL